MKKIYRSTLESLLKKDELFFKSKENAELAAINYLREKEGVEVDLNFRDEFVSEAPSFQIEEIF